MYLCRVGRKRRSARGADRSMCSRLTRNNFCLSDGGCGCVRVERTSITGFLSRQPQWHKNQLVSFELYASSAVGRRCFQPVDRQRSRQAQRCSTFAQSSWSAVIAEPQRASITVC